MNMERQKNLIFGHQNNIIMNIDVEIYIKNFVNFFESNPNELMDLIGDTLKEVFYDKVKEQCYKNLDNGEEITLTQKQLIDIVVDIKRVKPDINILLTNGVFQKTKYGLISLNQIWKFKTDFISLYYQSINNKIIQDMTKGQTIERTFNRKEVEEMCKQSYMRGMSIQHDTMTKKKMKPPKVFVEWVKQLIDECPVGKFK